MDSIEVAKLFEIKKNQIKLIRRRGYNVPENELDILKTTLQQFANTYIPFAEKKKKSLRAVLTRVYENDSGNKILVYYSDISDKNTQMGMEQMGHFLECMVKQDLLHAVIITPKKLSSQAVKHLNGLVSFTIDIFLEDEMTYDPTEHFLVPKHTALTEEEQREFLNQNNINVDQMPIILSSDIIIRNLGIRSGQVVKIERENMFETMILKSVCYKIVK